MQFNQSPSKVGTAVSFVVNQFKENKVRALTILGVLIVGFVLTFIIVSTRQKYDVRASDLYSQGYGLILAGNQSGNPQQQQQGVTTLEDLIKVYPKTPAAYEARLILSDFQFAQNNFAQALNFVYEVSQKGNPKAIRPIGLYRAIYIYDQTNDIDNAIKNSNDFIKKYSDNYLIRDVYMNLARYYLMKGDKDSSKKTYNDILIKFPATEEASIAQRFIEGIQ
ncbi:MAG: tetratricopeptide repeat protein [Elusimicrobiota bacterium]|jgi:TolA-binding protein|nr:tetratricopeptide repeat protein [Elusimicrobiota bacterium]